MAGEMKKRVVIDLVPIRPGRGGTGSGIWTVVHELVLHMDQLPGFQGLEIICLINREQQSAFANLQKIRCTVFRTLKKTYCSGFCGRICGCRSGVLFGA